MTHFSILSTLTKLIPALLFCASLDAQIRVTSLFGDHMILQQNSTNAIWGFGAPGEKVTLSSSWGEKVSTTTDPNGKWIAFLATPSYGTGFSIDIQGDNKIQLRDVAIGEVWLCAGQSNMGWAVGNTVSGEEDAKKANHPNLRIYRSAREHWHEPIDENRDRLAKWEKCTPEAALKTSAVSFYFAQKLHQSLDIPVGIIQRAFAGTPIEGWLPWDVQKNDPRAIAHKESMDSKLKDGQIEEGIAKFEKELAEYNRLIDSGETMKNSVKALSPPIITKPSVLGHQYPSHMYNAMIHPVMPYGIKGAIWYQGERNSKTAPQAIHYQHQMKLLIETYRNLWHQKSQGHSDKNFPFQFTQLPSWHAPQVKPVEGVEAVWSINRESMRLAQQNTPNAYMAVSIDTGSVSQLHPKNKKSIGLRHAYLALANTYEKDFVGSGPIFKSHRVVGNKIELSFDSIGSGLTPAKNSPLDTFAIAGEDRVWHWAKATIVDNKVLIESPKVSKPIAARYAWAMNPSQRNMLYNKEGIPASPFRTDDWPLYQPGEEELVVAKPANDKSAPQDWERPKDLQ